MGIHWREYGGCWIKEVKVNLNIDVNIAAAAVDGAEAPAIRSSAKQDDAVAVPVGADERPRGFITFSISNRIAVLCKTIYS